MSQADVDHWSSRLRRERIQRNWRQHDLAEQLGTTVLTVHRWERGIQQPDAYYRVKLCALFGKSAEELGLVAQASQSHTANERETSEVASASASLPEILMLWAVPYARNPHFTGREDLLAQLDQQFLASGNDNSVQPRRTALTQPQAIKGLGGIGKTQIAVEYAYRTREQGRYTHTIWINAAYEETIMIGFVTLAEQLPNFPAKNETDQRKLVAAILRWLEQCQEPWLLIFDNADDLALVQQYFPRQGNGSILLTTRTHAVGSLAVALEVETMGLMEGTHFLLRRTQRQYISDREINEATNVVMALDSFPLALDQAGAYIEETECRFEEYLQLYQEHRRFLLARRGRQATNYPDSVATTWSLSFQRVEQANPAAAELLRLCAFLAPDRIPEEIITHGTAYWPPLLQQAAADPFLFNQMIEDILTFSLVKRLTTDHLLSVHRLVQAVIVDTVEAEEQQTWVKRVVQATNEIFPRPVTAMTWSRCQRYLPQAQQCTLWIEEHGCFFEEAASLLFRTASYLYDHALYPQAERLFQQARNIWEQVAGPEHPDVANVYYRLGILYSQQGKYEQAESCYQRALQMREQIVGPEHPDVAASLYHLANLFAMQGKYEQAEPLFQRALHVREQALGPDHLDLAGSLDGLAILLAMQGKYEQAEPLFQRALRVREQALEPDHPDMAASLNNLAEFYQEQQKYKQAESCYQRALHIWEQALGPDHLYLAYPLAGLASLYCKQQRYKQAESCYQRALRIREQVQEQQNPEIAETLCGFAVLRQAQGKLLEAVSLYQRALAIKEQVLGAQHPRTVNTRTDYVKLLQIISDN